MIRLADLIRLPCETLYTLALSVSRDIDRGLDKRLLLEIIFDAIGTQANRGA